MPFFTWPTVVKDVTPGPTMYAGMSRQSYVHENKMFCMHEALPNLTCPPHRHDAEQTCIIIKGKMRFRIGQEERVLGPGDVAYVPSGVEHSIASLDEYVLALDIFAPLRPDIMERLKEIGL